MNLFAHARLKKNAAQNLSFGETMQTVELMVSCAQSPLEKVRAYNYAMKGKNNADSNSSNYPRSMRGLFVLVQAQRRTQKEEV